MAKISARSFKIDNGGFRFALHHPTLMQLKTVVVQVDFSRCTTTAVFFDSVSDYYAATSCSCFFFCVISETTMSVIKLNGMEMMPGLLRGMGAVVPSRP